MMDWLSKTYKNMVAIFKPYFYLTKRYRWFRNTLIVKMQCGYYGKNLRVRSMSKVTSTTYIGDNVNLNRLTVRGAGDVYIMDNFSCGAGTEIIAQNHDYEGDELPYGKGTIVEGVVIEPNVWVGRNVGILDGVRIGEGAIIQYGSVVVSDIPPLAIVGGHPARVFKYRDKEHYYRLKNEMFGD